MALALNAGYEGVNELHDFPSQDIEIKQCIKNLHCTEKSTKLISEYHERLDTSKYKSLSGLFLLISFGGPTIAHARKTPLTSNAPKAPKK